MDEKQLVVVVAGVIGLLGFVTLGVAVIALCRMLAYANKTVASLGERAFDGAMAFHESQREMKRLSFEADHQEFLLRESRDRAMRQTEVRPPVPSGDEPDITVTPPVTLG